MQTLLYVLLFLFTIVAMEVVAWATHKYLMHGPLWVLHRDHHKKTKGFFEWNDLFAVFFSAVAVVFMVIGIPEMNAWFWIGAGITVYGGLYFLMHDVVVHQRLRILRHVNFSYFKAVRKAHFKHHSCAEKNGATSFGFLWVSRRYFS